MAAPTITAFVGHMRTVDFAAQFVRASGEELTCTENAEEPVFTRHL